MASSVTGLRRPSLVAFAIFAMLAAATPTTPANAADADLRVLGGTGTAAVVCGNVAVAQTLANQRGIPLQKSRCTAQATGGSATLKDVDIFVSHAALAQNLNNPLLTAFADATAAISVAQDTCDVHRPTPAPGVQINKCFALSHGGSIRLINVKMVSPGSNGAVITRTLNDVTLPLRTSGPGATGRTDSTAAGPINGSAVAHCVNMVNHPLNQRDDCTAGGTGGSWSMQGVDAVVHNPGGSTSTRHGITVEVRGGDANASVYCFNLTDGSGTVIQINICNANSTAGDATLQNVTITTA